MENTSNHSDDDTLDHELNETDFTKKDNSKFLIEKRSSCAYSNKIEIGNMNIETPISNFIQKFYNKFMNSYVAHTQVFFNNCVYDINYIFLMKEDILITSNYEDENNKSPDQLPFIKFSPILMKIDYRQVRKNLISNCCLNKA
jgi:hypothetical protein